MKKIIAVTIIALFVLTLGYFASQGGDRFKHHSLMDELKHAHATPIDTDNVLDTAAFVRVHSSIVNENAFFTENRSSKITSFPCQNCHSISLESMQQVAGNQTQKAHWDIEIMHAGTSVMNCLTCHNPKDMNTLKSISGEPILMDRSFEMCSQCHSTQHNDWLGGAHGKRITGWKESRVAKTCVNCHNPHKPQIITRWPSRLVEKK